MYNIYLRRLYLQ